MGVEKESLQASPGQWQARVGLLLACGSEAWLPRLVPRAPLSVLLLGLPGRGRS